MSYSVQIAPQAGADDSLILLDLTNAGASGGEAVVDIDLADYDGFEVPVPPTGEVERTDRGLRWKLTLDSAQKVQLQIPVSAGAGDLSFPVIVVK